MTMKAMPPHTANTPGASNNASLAAALPEKTAEIERAGASFRRALQLEPQKNKRQALETQQSELKSELGSEMNSGQEIKKNFPQRQESLPPQSQAENSQPRSESNSGQEIEKNLPQHQESLPAQSQAENSQPRSETNSGQEIKKNLPQRQESLPPQSQTENSQPRSELNSGQEIKKNLPQHQTAHAQTQNKSIDKNTKEPSTQSTQDLPTQDLPTSPTIIDSAAINITSQPSAADQAAMVSTASSASPAELTAFIEKASQRILLARSDGAQNASLRIELHDNLLPQTQLIAQKQPDGSLNLTFTTNNPQSAHLLLQAQNGLAAHLRQTQNFNVNIDLANEQGQPLFEQNTADQNTPDQQNKKPDPNWDQVEAHLKKL